MNSNGFADFQIVDFLFKSVHIAFKITNYLGCHGIGRVSCVHAQFRKNLIPHFCQLFLPSLNIKLQLLEISQIFLIKIVKEDNILHHGGLGLFQLRLDFGYLGRKLFIGAKHIFSLVHQRTNERDFFHKAVILTFGKIVNFSRKVCKEFPYLTTILGANLTKKAIGKGRHVLLGCRAKLQSIAGIHQIDFSFDFLYLLAFGWIKGFGLGCNLLNLLLLVQQDWLGSSFGFFGLQQIFKTNIWHKFHPFYF